MRLPSSIQYTILLVASLEVISTVAFRIPVSGSTNAWRTTNEWAVSQQRRNGYGILRSAAVKDSKKDDAVASKQIPTIIFSADELTHGTSPQPSRRKEKKGEIQRREEYESRRALWEERYGSVEALRRTFGEARSFWGDLDPESTRQLYHTLLPRSLLGLYEAGLMRPDELAPLAYQARKAAKDYARERSTLPGRIVAHAFDGYRSFRRDGTFQTKGLSWEQLWDKYEAQIVEEECVRELETGDNKCRIDEEALASRIYLRILERSCATNEAFDRRLLHSDNHDDDDDCELDDGDDGFATISTKLENDVREILLNRKGAKRAVKFAEKTDKKRRKLRMRAAKVAHKRKAKEKKKAGKLEKERQKNLQKALRKAARQHRRKASRQEGMATKEAADTRRAEFDDNNEEDRRRRAYPALRIMARTRRLLRN